jgi:hypothetical protein
MPLPSSGPLALTDIQTEFGGSNPISLSEYYAGGAYVPAGTTGTYGAVPSSGAISIRNFYGTSNVVIAITNQTISAGVFSPDTAEAGYRLNSNGKVYKNQNGSLTEIETWCTPTSEASNYEARVTLLSGTTPSGSVGTWVALSSTRDWTIQETTAGNTTTSSIKVEIRRIGTTPTTPPSATIDLSATVQL